MFLHAEELGFVHPLDGRRMEFVEPARFDARWPGTAALARAMFREEETNAHRCWHGAAHGTAGWHLDRLGDWLMAVGEGGAPPGELAGTWPSEFGQPTGIYQKSWRRDVRQASREEACPALIAGTAAPPRFEILENGVRYGLSMEEGYSAGLFLDQRDNRRRLLAGHVGHAFPWLERGLAGRTVLNGFAYTGGFSVCAALAGAHVTTLDLSRKYLEWARDNFRRNGLVPEAHDFVFGDCFDWMGRFARKGRRFDVVLVDPPTFSRSKEHGDFRAEKDFGRLAGLAASLVAPGGVLFCSTNAARVAPEEFLGMVRAGVAAAGRSIRALHYAPQPPDFPVSRDEPAYLKTAWLRIDG
jgi:23S rRNA (cytosine1962-C5)-methyltransferase